MKTQRIRVEKGERAELFIAKRSPSCRYYSSVGDATDGGTRMKVDLGLRLSLTLKGPVTVSICISGKKKK